MARGKDKYINGAIASAGLIGYVSTRSAAAEPPGDDEIFDDVPVTGPVNEQEVQSLVAELTTTLLSWYWPGTAGPRCEALKRYYETGQQEFRAIANDFKNQNSLTIRNAINATNTDGCGPTEEEYSDLVRDRLNQEQIP